MEWKKEDKVAQVMTAPSALKIEGTLATRMDRGLVDKLISWSGAVVAVTLIALGAAAAYGGSFALENVRDRLEPQNITLPPLDAMTAAEKTEVGAFAGATVDTGVEAEAFSRYIGLHLTEIADGQTYAGLGPVQFGLQDEIAAAEEAGLPTAALEAELAAVTGQRDTLFKGETLKATLLNAYGWWTVGQITLYAGIGMVLMGIALAILAALGFHHAKKVRHS